MKRKPTPRDRVLKRYPLAFIYQPSIQLMQLRYAVAVDMGGPIIGRGDTQKLAWADAAQRLTRKRGER